MKPIRRFWIPNAILFTIGFAAHSSSAADPEFYYIYRGEKRALTIDESRVAVKLSSQQHSAAVPMDAAARGFASRAGGLGYVAAEGTGYRPAGWIKLETKSAMAKLGPATVGGRERHKRLLDDLARLEDVEFVSPVFKDRNGRPLSLEPTLLIGFVSGTSDAEQNSVLSRIVGVTGKRALGQKNNWAVEVGSRNGIDVLDAANRIATMPKVRYAEPNFLMSAVTR